MSKQEHYQQVNGMYINLIISQYYEAVKACIPVMALPSISAWISWVPEDRWGDASDKYYLNTIPKLQGLTLICVDWL